MSEYMRRELTENAAGIIKPPQGWHIHTVLNHGYSPQRRLYINALLERDRKDDE